MNTNNKQLNESYTLSELSEGDCVELIQPVRSLLGIIISKFDLTVWIKYKDGYVATCANGIKVLYKGKGKVIVEYAKEPTIHEAAEELKKQLDNIGYHFVKINKDSLTVYYYGVKNTSWMPTRSLGFPVIYVYVYNRVFDGV